MVTAVNTQAPAVAVAVRAEKPDAKAPDGGDKAAQNADAPQAAFVRISAEGADRAVAARAGQPDAKVPDSGNKAAQDAATQQAAIVRISAEGADRAAAVRAEKPDTKVTDSGNKAAQSADAPQAAVVRISAGAADRAAAVEQDTSDTGASIAAVDIDGDGKATTHEFKDGAPRAPQTRVTVDVLPAKASAGQPLAGDAGGGGATALSNSSRTYDPADVNQDGSVSAQELQSYDARLAADKAAQAAANNARSTEASAAVKAYQAVEQLNQNGGAGTAA